MTTPNARPTESGGPGGDEVVAATPILSPEPADAKSNPYRRARDLCIAAGLLHKHRPTPHELEIITSSWATVGDPDGQLFMLMIEATAPSRECADPAWCWALTREEDAAGIAAACLSGYFPEAQIEVMAKAAVAALFGATITIKRRAHNAERERDSLVAVMRKGVSDAA